MFAQWCRSGWADSSPRLVVLFRNADDRTLNGSKEGQLCMEVSGDDGFMIALYVMDALSRAAEPDGLESERYQAELSIRHDGTQGNELSVAFVTVQFLDSSILPLLRLVGHD
ncbi:hypothetical protein BLNAU_5848 [Blattamonas nauphoetae]|uniref:Uncharacterized protein n=1 Tax=Blattamonas nauphoetae TaxID=2049346 RepID=A0ABQ9Y6A0_9EUKA|nr:hypothetical protein BLNAU_5848 [Blattamonas nauphoetae]